MKRVTFNHLSVIKREEPKETYADLVNKTAQLINRKYFPTLKMIETWEPSEVQALYDDCITKWRTRGYKSPSHMWWTERGKKVGKIFNK